MTNPEHALVSIILITHNRASLIAESIDSIINQNYQHWELIVVDDGSDDGTSEIIMSFNDERIRYYFIPHTGRLGYVRNYGIRKALGDFIAFQDSDDLWRNDKLEFQLALFSNIPNASFILSNNTQFGINATRTPDYPPRFIGRLFIPILVDKKFHFCGTSLIFRKAVLDTVGLLEESIPRMRELHFFFRMSCSVDGIFTNERLVSVRRHPQNTSNTYLDLAHQTMLGMLTEFHLASMLTTKQFEKLAGETHYQLGLLYLKNDEPAKAYLNFLSHIKLKPAGWKGWGRLLESVGRRILSTKI